MTGEIENETTLIAPAQDWNERVYPGKDYQGAELQLTPTVEATVEQDEEVRIGGRELYVRLTFYNCYGQGGGYCGTMANGQQVYGGAAACGSSFQLGTEFWLADTRYVCADRGYLGERQVDIFFWNYKEGIQWQQAVGSYGVITIYD